MVALRSVLLVLCVIAAVSAYNPDLQNIYHLFTRENPSVSQPMVLGTNSLLYNSNFVAGRRTVLLIHGWTGSATSDINTVVVPAYLSAADANVFVVDWSAGASVINLNASENAVASGLSVALFIDWVVQQTGAGYNDFHIIGHSLGAHQAGVAGRNTYGRIPYITALDPGANMEDSGHIFGPDAAIYTEAIHTNAFIMGHGDPVAHVDFYPNGGDLMPGCGVNFLCNHNRAIFYFGETLTHANFIGRSCGTLAQAQLNLCVGLVTLEMGGITAKSGATGIYRLETNAESPFGQGEFED